jgi:hypothetical protein
MHFSIYEAIMLIVRRGLAVLDRALLRSRPRKAKHLFRCVVEVGYALAS